MFFESPHRTEASLAAMAEAFHDDRAGAVCRELTKTHEAVRRGPLAELAAWAADGVRGEVTLVVAGATPAAQPADPAAWRLAVEDACTLRITCLPVGPTPYALVAVERGSAHHRCWF